MSQFQKIFIYLYSRFLITLHVKKIKKSIVLLDWDHMKILMDPPLPLVTQIVTVGNNSVFFIDFSNFQCKSINNRYATGGTIPDAYSNYDIYTRYEWLEACTCGKW